MPLLVSQSGPATGPTRLIDPRTQEKYILLREEDYARLTTAGEETHAISDFLAPQLKSAWKAGWNAPEMDDYDRYDELKGKP